MKFVSKDLAIKLKEKGFDKPCFGWFFVKTPTGMNEGELILNRYLYRGGTYKQTLERHIFLGTISNVVDAPTIEQVLEWFREEKKIHIVIDFTDDMIWYFQISKYYAEHYEYQQYGYNSYDDAILAGIEYIVEHLI